jgi:H+/Cl- antiporter ClcA
MVSSDSPPPSRLERVLATVIASIIGLSIAAFIAIIMATWQGFQSDDFTSGVWPAVTFLPLVGLPSGFVLILVLLVISTRRRSGGHGTS